jgi:uncharacterized protein (DUF1501 family)
MHKSWIELRRQFSWRWLAANIWFRNKQEKIMKLDKLSNFGESKPQTESPARRDFLRRSAQLAFTGAAMPTAINLAAMGDAAAFTAPDGSYKALVCVFLYGANDYANTVVAYDDASYDKYSTIRGGGVGRTAGGIALAKADLTATLLNPTVPLPGGRQYALHPSMAGLAGLFNAGQAAVQLNVGPLIEPITRVQYNAFAKKFPPKLFSHNDQQSIWQSSESEGSTIGWGGNLGDFGFPVNASGSTFSCVSVTGNAVFLAGDTALAYQVSKDGAVKLSSINNTKVYNSTPVGLAINQLIVQTGTGAQEIEYNNVTRRSIAAETKVTGALAGAGATSDSPNFTAFTTTMLAENLLAGQLKMVARMIAGRAALGSPKRQVFMVSLGGFDLHDNLISQHPNLLRYVSEAMTAFHDATVKLGVDTQVTSFTASDFGRTLTSNGDGSDHGWGSHHFVVGGAVNGKAFYGYAPPISTSDDLSKPDNIWHVGQGRLLPTTSVDQYAATMATWFGVEDNELIKVVPNILNFDNVTQEGILYKKNLGFMKP